MPFFSGSGRIKNVTGCEKMQQIANGPQTNDTMGQLDTSGLMRIRRSVISISSGHFNLSGSPSSHLVLSITFLNVIERTNYIVDTVDQHAPIL